MASLRKRKPALSAPTIEQHLAKGRRLRDARARILAAKLAQHIGLRARLAHRVGATLNLLQRERLWGNLGHVSFDAFVASVGLGRSQAWKWMAIADALSESRAAELGVEAAYVVARARRRTRP